MDGVPVLLVLLAVAVSLWVQYAIIKAAVYQGCGSSESHPE